MRMGHKGRSFWDRLRRVEVPPLVVFAIQVLSLIVAIYVVAAGR